MPSLQIYAAGIKHLSDARYFAAMGAHFMGFNPKDFEPIETLGEIVEWVEGPKFILELDDAMDLDRYRLGISSLPFSAVVVDAKSASDLDAPWPLIQKWPVDAAMEGQAGEILLHSKKEFASWSAEEIARIRSLCSTADVWLDVPESARSLHQMMTDLGPFGLVLKGGNEEKVGLKNYATLDEIFDIIEALS